MGGRQAGARVPFVAQMSEVECGPACLAMVLGAHRHRVPLRELRAEFGVSRDGASARRILEVARAHGLEARGLKVPPDALGAVRKPAIAHWDDHHFVVVEGVGRKGVRVLDPGEGRATVSPAEFRARSSGTLLEFAPGSSFIERRGPRDSWPLRLVRDMTRMAPRWAALAVLLSGMVQLLALGSAFLTKYGIDTLIGERAGTLSGLSLAIAGFVSVYALIGLGRAGALLVLQHRLDGALGDRFMTHLFRLPFGYFQARSSGDLLARLNSNTVIRDLLTSRMVTLIIDSVFVVGYLVLLCAVSPWYALLAAGLGAAQIAIVLATLRPANALAKRELSAEAATQSVAVDALRGAEFVKSAGLVGTVLDRWRGSLGDYLRAALRRRRLDALTDSLTLLLQVASPLVLLLLGVAQVRSGALTIGSMIALNAIAAGLLTPIAGLATSARYLQTIGAHLERVHDVLDERPEVRRPGITAPATVRGEIELRGVGFRYGQGPWILRDLTLRVPAGAKLAVVGASGSGKTTMIRLLAGLLRPTEGTVLLDGRAIEEYDADSLRRRFGVVTQEPHVFGGTIGSNLRLGRGDLPDEALFEALGRAGLLPDVRRMPMGLETHVAEGGSALSGGQRQRLAIARALLADPALLVLDEATSHLDAVTEAEVAGELSALGCTRIVVAHRISTIMDADEIVVLDDGRFTERGGHDDLMLAGGRYAALVHRQLPASLRPS
ncbi:peptidase domain-containing ABC transporter [Streptomyces rhizosphaericus]|uniref:Peptidase domain-containing ABC transporter n=1 Tax=Streptomyces rhizosphaericus TaxID=114699 RepID=A0A6G4ADI3_9ACTN|nr:peptidase domain-containing ABC transporter [Streptomyces rhizosphaericus]NEW71332.1 peptidase domain-containing ABC transporter [Streptomyces rhizosphaericus]